MLHFVFLRVLDVFPLPLPASVSAQRRGYSSGGGSGGRGTEPPSCESAEGWEIVDGGDGEFHKQKPEGEREEGGDRGGSGGGSDPRKYATGSTDPSSSSRTLRVRSSSSLSVAVFSTLSPVSSSASGDYLSDGGGGEGDGRGMGEEGGGGGAPSPGTLSQLAMVKGQLTDALRALAVSFGQVGYCQGEEGCSSFLCGFFLGRGGRARVGCFFCSKILKQYEQKNKKGLNTKCTRGIGTYALLAAVQR